MPAYQAPVRDIRFVLREVLGVDRHYQRIGARDATPDVVDAIISEAAAFGEKVIAPLHQAGDQGCRYEDGRVTTPPGFRDAYRRYVEAGWPSLSGPPEYGGQGLPASLNAVLVEVAASANMAWYEYPGLCEGAISTLLEHGTPALKDRYLPPLVSGEWLGTMCLTEPHCGTDLGLMRTRAEAGADGDYELTGTKIFITSGEHDFTDNIVHIVLARLAGAPAGTRGISLFLVPKVLPDGSRNGVRCGSIEHKMGIRGSATTVLNFEGARGFLVGPPNEGLRCMFTFMNHARVGAARLGVCAAERSFQGAVAYAQERLAMRSLSGPRFPDRAADPIIVHPDVRRMLLTQKAIAEGGRAFASYLSLQVDLSQRGPTSADRAAADRLLGVLTPIAKGVLTELGYEAAGLGVQVFGGHGFIAEHGMEQILRDSRILTLWEGTTGVQALDLLGRKVVGSRGAMLEPFWSLVRGFCDEAGGDDELASFRATLRARLEEWQELTQALLERAARDPEEIGAASVDYLMYSGYVVLAWFWALMAHSAQQANAASPAERAFYDAKRFTARFYFERMLPRTTVHRAGMLAGAATLMPPEQDPLCHS